MENPCIWGKIWTCEAITLYRFRKYVKRKQDTSLNLRFSSESSWNKNIKNGWFVFKIIQEHVQYTSIGLPICTREELPAVVTIKDVHTYTAISVWTHSDEHTISSALNTVTETSSQQKVCLINVAGAYCELLLHWAFWLHPVHLDLRYIQIRLQMIWVRFYVQANTSLCKHHLPKHIIHMVVLDIIKCYIVFKRKAAVKETTSTVG